MPAGYKTGYGQFIFLLQLVLKFRICKISVKGNKQMEVKIEKANGQPLSAKDAEILFNYLKDKFESFENEEGDYETVNSQRDLMRLKFLLLRMIHMFTRQHFVRELPRIVSKCSLTMTN